MNFHRAATDGTLHVISEMNFRTAANEASFAIRTLNKKQTKQLPKEIEVQLRKFEEILIEGNTSVILEHCESIYQILINIYGDDSSIPETVIEYIYPYSNTDLIPEVQLTIALFLFNKHPNRKYFNFLKYSAEELNINGVTIEEISQRIKNQVSNSLACWRALKWEDKESPFGPKKRVA